MFKEQLSPLQEKLLEMIKWFHEFCVNNEIPYYITSGTMLGAARHEGFIPWDDDIDVAIPRPHYNRLCELLCDRVDHYIIETPYSQNNDYIYGYAKLYDMNTTMIEHMRKDIKRGILIDIFPLDGLGNSYEESIKNYKRIDVYSMFLAARTCAIRKGRSLWKNASIIIAGMLPTIIVDNHLLAQKVDKKCQVYGYENSAFVASCLSTYRSIEIMEKRIYGKPTLYRFEDTYLFGPELYEEYLTKLFNDWRMLPPKEKRVSVHNYLQIDYNKSFIDIFGD